VSENDNRENATRSRPESAHRRKRHCRLALILARMTTLATPLQFSIIADSQAGPGDLSRSAKAPLLGLGLPEGRPQSGEDDLVWLEPYPDLSQRFWLQMAVICVAHEQTQDWPACLSARWLRSGTIAVTLRALASVSEGPARHSLLQALAPGLETALRDLHRQEAVRAPAALARWRARRVRQLMQDNPDRRVSLSELADAGGLSPHHFCRVFRHDHGASPVRFQRALRLEQAQRALTTSDRSVTDIALAAGYLSSQAFSHAFRKVYGVSPAHYRRAQQMLDRVDLANAA
jgi:AraC-like DNA-binding protein